MARELGHPTEAFELVDDQVMKPCFKELTHTFRSVVLKELEETRLMLNILSILAMVLYFNFPRMAVTQITGCQYDTAFKARLAEYIINLSIGGLGERKSGLTGFPQGVQKN
jgi:hypothetical protein